jgi:hypothetical protein
LKAYSCRLQFVNQSHSHDLETLQALPVTYNKTNQAIHWHSPQHVCSTLYPYPISRTTKPLTCILSSKLRPGVVRPCYSTSERKVVTGGIDTNTMTSILYLYEETSTVALAMPGLLWLLYGKGVTAVIEAWSPPCVVLLKLGCISPLTVSDKKELETIGRGTYGRQSLPPRLVQAELRPYPWTACRQTHYCKRRRSASSTWPANQLNDLIKQGKLNQWQTMQVRS